MKKILIDTGYDVYNVSDSCRELSTKVLEKFYSRPVRITDLPINPFKILEKSGVVYSFADFSDLEGFYCLPENDEVGIVGINKNRPIHRQRFTAAHELCHHLKDSRDQICKIGMTDPIEIYANNFASELLFPETVLEYIINKFEMNVSDLEKLLAGVQSELDKVLKISVLFGTSMESTARKLLKYFNYRYAYPDLKKVLKKYKVSDRKEILGIDDETELWIQVVDSYQFLKVAPPKELKTFFLNYVIENDHRMENGNLSILDIRKTLVKIRSGISTEKLDNNEVEVLGQYNMYEKIFDDTINGRSYQYVLSLHKQFYKHAPFPEVGGRFREAGARLAGTNVRTSDPRKIGLEVYELSLKMDQFLEKSTVKNSVVISNSVNWHHALTVIHPFYDGNGRTIRALSNSILLHFNIPPIFILEKEKEKYRTGLAEMDSSADKSKKLLDFILKKVVSNYSYFLPEFEE